MKITKFNKFNKIQESLEEDGILIYEEDITEDMIDTEDGGAAKILNISNDESKIAVTLTSWDEDDDNGEIGQHDEMNQLIGHRIRITVEII